MPPKTKAVRKPVSTAATGDGSEVATLAEPSTAPSVPPTEVYALLQGVVAEDPAKISEHLGDVLALLAAAESATTPLLLRVKFLEFITTYVSDIQDEPTLQKVFVALVNVVSGEDNTPQLLSAALQCFGGLGPASTRGPSWEYLSSEGSDVVMQVLLDKEAFPESVRATAAKALDTLTDRAFLPVVKKLIQWISTKREPDDEEQISKERHFALSRLKKLALTPTMRAHWTPEVQKQAFSLLCLILESVDAREFNQIMLVAASLPIIREQNGIPLVQEVLSAAPKLADERGIESVAAALRHVPATAEYDLLPGLEAAGFLKRDIDLAGDIGVYETRVLLFASRCATVEGAQKLLPVITAQLARIPTDLQSVNLSTLEALLFCFVRVAVKLPTEAIQKLNDDSFSSLMKSLCDEAETTEKLAKFAVLKSVDAHTATPQQAELLASLHNVQVIAGSFAAKHLPMGDVKESWIGQHKLPALKRGREGEQKGLPSAQNKRPRTHSSGPPPGKTGYRNKKQRRN